MIERSYVITGIVKGILTWTSSNVCVSAPAMLKLEEVQQAMWFLITNRMRLFTIQYNKQDCLWSWKCPQ